MSLKINVRAIQWGAAPVVMASTMHLVSCYCAIPRWDMLRAALSDMVDPGTQVELGCLATQLRPLKMDWLLYQSTREVA